MQLIGVCALICMNTAFLIKSDYYLIFTQKKLFLDYMLVYGRRHMALIISFLRKNSSNSIFFLDYMLVYERHGI